jgi:hypothetical protein
MIDTAGATKAAVVTSAKFSLPDPGARPARDDENFAYISAWEYQGRKPTETKKN